MNWHPYWPGILYFAALATFCFGVAFYRDIIRQLKTLNQRRKTARHRELRRAWIDAASQADYSRARAKALKQLGDRHLTAVPINRRRAP
jgi:hypothetical protein